jgi:hypothetical protein
VALIVRVSTNALELYPEIVAPDMIDPTRPDPAKQLLRS